MSSPFEPPRRGTVRAPMPFRGTVLPKILVAGWCFLYAALLLPGQLLIPAPPPGWATAARIVSALSHLALVGVGIAAVRSAIASRRPDVAADGAHPDLAFWRWATLTAALALLGDALRLPL